MTTTSEGICELKMKPQEVPSDDPTSNCFLGLDTRTIVTTPAALDVFSPAELQKVLKILDEKASTAFGLDYLAVFEAGSRKLFVVDDGNAVNLMLPSDY